MLFDMERVDFLDAVSDLMGMIYYKNYFLKQVKVYIIAKLKSLRSFWEVRFFNIFLKHGHGQQPGLAPSGFLNFSTKPLSK